MCMVSNKYAYKQMGSIHEAYMQMKVQFSGPNATEPMRSLNLINPDFKELAGYVRSLFFKMKNTSIIYKCI